MIIWTTIKRKKISLKLLLEFANKVPFYGVVALNAHDEKLMHLKTELKRPAVNFWY